MLEVRVTPEAVGWSVSGVGASLFFTGGGGAERAARRIAEAFAQAGRPVRLLIADRTGRLVGDVRLAPQPEPQAAASSFSGSTA